MATRTINQIPVDSSFQERLCEATTKEEWKNLLDTLQGSLLQRMAATPDTDLPRLKGKVEYIGELRNFFVEIFS